MTQEEVLQAERAVVDVSFGGSRSAYHAALARARATRALARSIIADRIRRGRIEQELSVAEPTAAAVARFYASYPNELIRRFTAAPSPWWLGGRPAGYALRRVAPARAFALSTGDETTLGSAANALTVKALTPPVPVGALPLALARPAIRTALVSFARGDAFDRWAYARQAQAHAQTICLRDDLPEVAVVDVAIYLPFLDLNF